MKKIISLMMVLGLMAGLTGCDGDYGYPGGGDNISGGQSPIGEVGNTFSGGTLDGYDNVTAEVTDLTDGISTVRLTGVITDSKMLTLLRSMPDKDFVSFNSATGQFTADLKFRFTENGISEYNHYDNTEWTLINYSGGVGDKYSFKDSDGEKFEREITQKSTEDDYPYGFWNIKTTTVEEPSRSPLINKVVYRFNHKFGPVNIKLVLADGHVFESKVYSYAEND